MENALKSYNLRRKKWKKGLNSTTRYIAQLADTILVEHFESYGYKVSPYRMDEYNNIVERNETLLEKQSNSISYNIQISFDKYDRPRFQVNLIKRNSSDNFKIVDKSNVVANPTQYIHFWGKPWWLPEMFWHKSFSYKQIEKIIRLTPQIERFFEQGERGRNISPIVKGSLHK